jgi:hypothetical protein
MITPVATIWSVIATAGLPVALGVLALSALVKAVRARRAQHPG